MRHLFTLLLVVPLLSFGQETTGLNYVANTSNSATPGLRNTLVGADAGSSITTGKYNTFVGQGAGNQNTSGDGNALIGVGAGYLNTNGYQNTFVGFQAGSYNTTGYQNTFLGTTSGFANTTGTNNIFIGVHSGFANTKGSNHVFLGNLSGHSNTIGPANTFLGYSSGYWTTTGANNVCVGTNAGYNNATGDNNVMLGANTQPASDNLQNTVAIGTNAQVALSNAIVLGDYTNTSIAVGIGTNAPQFPLDVRGIINLRGNGTLKFSHLFNPNLRNGVTDQFLTVDDKGETVLAKYRSQIANVDQWSDKVFEKNYPLKPLAEVENYIDQYKHLPGVPSAEEVVEEGFDPARMDAKLLEKIEELTLHGIRQEKTIRQQQTQIDELKQLVKQLINSK
jgi:hypothetical protein